MAESGRVGRAGSVVAHRPTAWATHWETALDAGDHAELSALLAASYPSTTAFADGRSWAGARPELRLVGRRHGGAVAHAAVVPRLLRFPDGRHDPADTDGPAGPAGPAGPGTALVGDVGLVAVCPGLQGEGVGVALMAALAATLDRLELPFGFLTCSDALRPFYERCGWTALTDRVLRAVTLDHTVESGHRGMVLGVRSGLAAWPSGTVERNGQEI